MTATESRTRLFHELLMAGYGGQGVLKMGQLLAEAAMVEGLEVALTPAYGPEMRGGPSYGALIISSDPIGSPVSSLVDTAVIMDNPSLPKHQARVRPTGRMLLNSTLVDVTKARTDIDVYAVPATAIADELGESVISNMVMLGALVKITGLATLDHVLHALREGLPERRRHLLPLNEAALTRGADEVRKL